MKKFLVMLALGAGLFSFGISSASAGLVARVDISSQTLTVVKDGRVMYRWPVSTARKGYVTPTGSWSPKRTHRMWYSRKYHMSPMPFAVFYNRGFAIHGTGAVSRLGRPASHGCVRLLTSNARTFYSLVQQVGMSNTRVVVRH